ncbi:MAG TPA: ATPase, T2SS/T4P/T4SS family [Gammaproteobacteria bacterium]|nr:ATPase, T2SS/T4P/T4SS family [Gammaproteobacteria bacterium]
MSLQLRKKVRLGELLVENRIISQQQLDAALAEQQRSGRKLGRILIDSAYLTEDALLSFLSQQLDLPFVELAHYRFEASVVRLIPEIHARRFRAVALKDKGTAVQVGLSEPTNIFAYDELTRLIGRPIEVAVVREQELLDALERVYAQSDRITGIAEQLSDELKEGDFDVDQLAAGADLSDAPVVKLLHTLFQAAVQARSSDIHIEPDEAVLRIRQRIDGVLHEQVLNEKRIAPALVQRLKLMANLDIAEKRLPQDGRFSLRVSDRVIDVRVSTMPLQFGESVVMRLLDQSEGVRELDALGMPPALLERFQHAIARPHGMVVVTGPTGSGKTSTLYSALKRLNAPEVKIITVEDPVEYRLPRVNQVQVNAQVGLSFARVLRTTLRQDPDIVLVGEMRDQETVEIGLRAAMTGHLVLTTLHTNDAVSTVSRLLDMGAAPYLLASSINAVLAQRLLRRICAHCEREDALSGAERAWAQAHLGVEAQGFRRGEGCHQCNNTGYRGRLGVYEMLEIDAAMGQALAQGDLAGFATLARASRGYRPLALAALDYAAQGVTTVAEAMRVAADGAREIEAIDDLADARAA